MNRFITFEGIEGCGKSTQIRLAAQCLMENNIPMCLTQEPSGTDIGRKIGGILFNRGHHAMCAETEVLLFFAARAQHVREVVFPALAENRWVLCDRFSDATFAYQGAGRGLDRDFLRRVNDYCAPQLKPAMTLLFDCPVEIGLERARKRDEQLENPAFSDRFEREKIEFHNRVREGYLSLSREEPARFRLINAAREMETIQQDVRDRVMEFIGSTNPSG
ncbi:MAG: dTMP kinase [Smithellaceae bacterium]